MREPGLFIFVQVFLLLTCAQRTGNDEVSILQFLQECVAHRAIARCSMVEHRNSWTVLHILGTCWRRNGRKRLFCIRRGRCRDMEMIEMENTRGRERHAPASSVVVVEKRRGSRCYFPHTTSSSHPLVPGPWSLRDIKMELDGDGASTPSLPNERRLFSSFFPLPLGLCFTMQYRSLPQSAF